MSTKRGGVWEPCDKTVLYLGCGGGYVKLTKVIKLHRTRHPHPHTKHPRL